MNNSRKVVPVSKTETARENSRRELEALFTKEPSNNTVLTEERAKQIMEMEMQKLGIIQRPDDARTRATDIEMREREMCLRERQAGVNASKAVTGVLATWVVIGTAMLARSCVNFDKGPKFQVNSK